jgi:hypothetical protein
LDAVARVTNTAASPAISAAILAAGSASRFSNCKGRFVSRRGIGVVVAAVQALYWSQDEFVSGPYASDGQSALVQSVVLALVVDFCVVLGLSSRLKSFEMSASS